MLEYFAYYPINKSRSFSFAGKRRITATDIKNQLPKFLVKELLSPPNQYCVSCLYVEKDKENVINFLDEKWVTKGELGKNREIEITLDELGKHDYFFVDLKNIGWGEDVDYEFDKPSCSHNTCPWGSKITSKIRIAETIIGKYDFVKISGGWDQNVRFLISNRIRNIFDKNGISGLSYDACSEHISTDQETGDISQTYSIATITTSYVKNAADILLRDCCKKHSIIIDATPINVKYPNTTSRSDFQGVDKIFVGKKEYTLRSPWFFMSRKVLRILLDNKVKDLRPMTLFIKNGFRVVPFDERV